MGQQIVTFRVWDPTGKVIYSTDETAVGKTFPVKEGMARAILGQVNSEISNLEAEENAPQRAIRSELLETYSPVRLSGTNEVIAVAEFYQTVDCPQPGDRRGPAPELARGGLLPCWSSTCCWPASSGGQAIRSRGSGRH